MLLSPKFAFQLLFPNFSKKSRLQKFQSNIDEFCENRSIVPKKDVDGEG